MLFSLLFLILLLLPLALNVVIPSQPGADDHSKIELSGPGSDWKIPINNGDDSEIVCKSLKNDPTTISWDCNGTLVSSFVIESSGDMKLLTRRMLRLVTFSNSALDAEVIEKRHVYRAGIHNPIFSATAITMQGTGDNKDSVMVALVHGTNYEVMADLIWKRLSNSDKLPQFRPDAPNPNDDSLVPDLPELPQSPNMSNPLGETT